MSEEIYTVNATSINKVYKIPVKLLSHHKDTILHNETVYTLFHALHLPMSELTKKVQEALEVGTTAHQAIFTHLGLDHSQRAPGTEESYIAVAIHEWKPEKKETTITSKEIEKYI